MAQPQKGICAEPNLHSLYLMFNVVDDDYAALRERLAMLLDLFYYNEQEYFEAMLSGMIAIGSNFWSEIYPHNTPAELAPFPDTGKREPRMPVIPFDLFIQIRADRADVCHQLGVEVCRLLSPYTELVEQIKGFRFLDGRDLTGFVMGYDNPRGMAKLDVALVGEEDPKFAGGSYIHVQRYQHNLAQWERLSVAEQEYIMGRSKDTNSELDDHARSPACHATRISVDKFGEPIKLLQQGMPYGDMHEQGMYLVTCARTVKPFRHMLENLVALDREGQYDRLLDFTTVQTGCAFFAPSISFIKKYV